MTDNTNKCINKIKNKMGKMEQKLDDIEEKLNDMPTKEGMDLANEKLIKRVLKETDNRYADKRTEKIVNALVIGIFVLGLAITIAVLFGQQLPIEVGL